MTYPVGWMLDNLAMWQCVFALSFAGLIHSCLGILEVSKKDFSPALQELEAQIDWIEAPNSQGFKKPGGNGEIEGK
jgi:hypothetical protein